MIRILLGLSFIFISSSAFAECGNPCSFSDFQKEKYPQKIEQYQGQLDLSSEYPIEKSSEYRWQRYLTPYPQPDIYYELDIDPYRPYYVNPPY